MIGPKIAIPTPSSSLGERKTVYPDDGKFGNPTGQTTSRHQRVRAINFTPLSFTRPAIYRIKTLVQELFANDRSLGLAFREGKRQSDADWQSLYDDLVAMGAIKADDGVL